MTWYKLAQSALHDLFDIPYKKIVKKDSPQMKLITLTLYRSFDADIEGLERVGNGYLLSPHKCEQGVL